MSANIISVDEESLRNDIENLVRKTVEETPDALLDEEASELVEAGATRGGPGGPPQQSLHEEARHGRRGSRAQHAEAPRDGREDGARRVRRDAGLHGIPAGALAPDQDEQRDRAHRLRDQEEDEGRRDLPGRQLGRHTGVSETEVHSGARMGQEEVPGHVQTGGDGRAEGKSGGLEEDEAEDGQINLRKYLDGTRKCDPTPRFAVESL